MFGFLYLIKKNHSTNTNQCNNDGAQYNKKKNVQQANIILHIFD